MTMAPLPSAVRGNFSTATSSEQILLRPPSFDKFFKSARNMQYKTLQVERRFSHYEQKVANAPIERCGTKMPRRLQTRKITRQNKPQFDEERIHWNERLAAWLREDQSSSVEYIKISDQFNLIEKQLFYCSACHEYFHLNLREREKRNAGCPRFRGHHDDHVRPVTIKKAKKPRRKRPTVVPKDPFGDRSNLSVPSLLPPKPVKRFVQVAVDIPRLPPISKATTSRTNSLPQTGNSPRKPFASPASTTPSETSTAAPAEKRTYSPIRLPNILSPETETSVQETVSPEEDDEEVQDHLFADMGDESVRTAQPEDSLVEEQGIDDMVKIDDVEDADDVNGGNNGSTECKGCPPEHGEVVGSSRFVGKRKGVSFNGVALNDILECSDVESLEHDVDSVDHDEEKTEEIEEDTNHEETEMLSVSEEADVEDELQIPSSTTDSSPSPQHTRPRPPPPDLPIVRLEESPDFQDQTKPKKPLLKKRKAMFLPPIKKEPQQNPKPEKPKVKRMTSDELARRFKKAKELEGYRRKYEFQGDAAYDVTTDDDVSVASQEMEMYDDSFLEKYCLIPPEHLQKCKRIFNKFDKDRDGLLKSEEVVNAIHKMFSPNVLDDVQMCYIFRILETTSFDVFTEKMNLKLFAIVVALAERISQLDEHMKHLLGRVNVEVVDWKLSRARQLFEHTMRRDAQGTFKMPMESFWLELHAGGVSEAHEKQARRSLSHMKEMDLLDFLTYLPLFLLVHSNVVNNPLNADRHV